MPRVFLSLGSNVEPEANLRLGVAQLRQRFGELALSPVYRNKAVGFEGDDFLNLVAGLDTDASIESIVEQIELIHTVAGRKRGKERNSSRTLDIDLLTWGDTVTDASIVTLPRADILDYAFVLKPLVDIAPDDCHPVSGKTYASHWGQMRLAGHDLRRVDLDL